MGTMSHPTYPAVPIKDMYCWNYYLTRDLENITGGVGSSWILPIIHGAFLQRKIMYGRTLNLILLARRSRHFAGTRYLKRGVSDQGKVANDVEHEQILHDESSGVSSAYLQMRGSIPTYWTQVWHRPTIDNYLLDLHICIHDCMRPYSIGNECNNAETSHRFESS